LLGSVEYQDGLSTIMPITFIGSQMLTGTRLTFLIRMITGVRMACNLIKQLRIGGNLQTKVGINR